MALGAEYECHVCGRTYPAALVVVGQAAPPDLPLPLADAVATADGLAARLPERPVVVGGDAAHAPLLASLRARHGAVAYGDDAGVRSYTGADGAVVGLLAAPGADPARVCAILGLPV